MIQISYDKEGDLFEIRFSANAIKDSEYVKESGLVVGYDKNGDIVAVEMIAFSKRVSKEQLVEAIAV